MQHRRPPEPLPVLVERDGAWHEGQLEWAGDDAGWRALVRYSTAPGYRFEQWVAAGRVRAQ